MSAVVPESRHPKLEGLLDLWVRRCAGRTLPARRDFSIEDFRPWLGHLALIDVTLEPPRFKIRLAGTIVTAYEGQDDTGRYLDEVIPEDERDRRLQPYLECIRTHQPVFDLPSYPRVLQPDPMYRRLLLPCATDGSTVDVIILAVYADY